MVGSSKSKLSLAHLWPQRSLKPAFSSSLVVHLALQNITPKHVTKSDKKDIHPATSCQHYVRGRVKWWDIQTKFHASMKKEFFQRKLDKKENAYTQFRSKHQKWYRWLKIIYTEIKKKKKKTGKKHILMDHYLSDEPSISFSLIPYNCSFFETSSRLLLFFKYFFLLMINIRIFISRYNLKLR